MGSEEDRGSQKRDKEGELCDPRRTQEEFGNVRYEIIYSPKAKKSVHKLPEDIRIRVIDKLEKAQPNPFHFFVRLSGRKDYKLRVGKYRVIADINRIRIEVTAVELRDKIYD